MDASTITLTEDIKSKIQRLNSLHKEVESLTKEVNDNLKDEFCSQKYPEGAVIENGTGIYLIRKVDVSWLYDQSQEFGDITIRQEGSKKLANNKFSNVVGHRFTLSCFSRLAKVVSLPTE